MGAVLCELCVVFVVVCGWIIITVRGVHSLRIEAQGHDAKRTVSAGHYGQTVMSLAELKNVKSTDCCARPKGCRL